MSRVVDRSVSLFHGGQEDFWMKSKAVGQNISPILVDSRPRGLIKDVKDRRQRYFSLKADLRTKTRVEDDRSSRLISLSLSLNGGKEDTRMSR